MTPTSPPPPPRVRLPFVVNPLGITAAAVSVSLIYGSPSIPAVTGTLSGVLPADQANVMPTFTGIICSGGNQPIGPTSNVGVYPILTTLTGSAANNYTVTATSGTVTITIATSSSALTYSPKNVGPATTVTFTDAITPQLGGTPTGTVTYTDNSPIGPVTLGTLKASTSNTLAVTLATVGTHVITATYATSTNFIGSAASITIMVAAPTFTTIQSAASVNVVQGRGGAYAFHLPGSRRLRDAGRIHLLRAAGQRHLHGQPAAVYTGRVTGKCHGPRPGLGANGWSEPGLHVKRRTLLQWPPPLAHGCVLAAWPRSPALWLPP